MILRRGSMSTAFEKWKCEVYPALRGTRTRLKELFPFSRLQIDVESTLRGLPIAKAVIDVEDLGKPAGHREQPRSPSPLSWKKRRIERNGCVVALWVSDW
jgi:hypothetical protein